MNFFKRKKEGGENYKLIKTVLIVLVVVLLVYLILWKTGVLETVKIAKQIQDQRAVAAEDQKMLKELKKIIELPEDVQPLIAKVSDADALRDQNSDFFANAKNGDRVIVYPDMAILYDENAEKILKVGPVNFGEGSIGTVPFVLYNGTGDENKLNEFAEKLKNTFNNANIKQTASAASKYDQTLVIDLMGDNPEINKIADSLNGQVAELPAGETKPEDAAVLIIVGNNQ